MSDHIKLVVAAVTTLVGLAAGASGAAGAAGIAPLARHSQGQPDAGSGVAVVVPGRQQPDAEVSAEVPEVEWDRLPEGPDRALHSMILDTANDMLWSFGGIEADAQSNDFKNTLYRLDLADAEARWVRLAIGGLRPPPLAFHSAIYDPLRERMIVYGGLLDRTEFSDQRPADGNSVWFLDLTDPTAPSWSRDSVAGNATDRFAHAATYVPGADAMIVSGGLSTFSNARNDNYALMLGEEPMRWQRLANAGFNYRGGHALIHDAEGQRLLAYGGLKDLSNVNTLSDVVSLDLSQGLDGADTWRRVSTSTPGLSRAFMATAHDPDRNLWWVQGGIVTNNRFLRDLSVLDLSQEKPEWIRTQVVYNGPLERFGHPGVWDGLRQRMIVQGGTPDNNVTLKDTRAMRYVAVATATPSATASSTPTDASPPTPTDDPSAGTATPTEAAITATPTNGTSTPTPTVDGPTVTSTPTGTSETPTDSSTVFLPIAAAGTRP